MKIKIISQPVRSTETEELKKSIASDLLAKDKSLDELLTNKDDNETTAENIPRKSKSD